MPCVDTVCEMFPQTKFKRQNVIAATQFQKIDGLLLFRYCRDGHLRRKVPDCQGDVGINRVCTVCDHQPCLGHLQRLVGGSVLHSASHHRHAVDVQLHRFHRVRLDHKVLDFMKSKTRHQFRGQTVK